MNTPKHKDGKKQFNLMLGRGETKVMPRTERLDRRNKEGAWKYVGRASQIGFDIAFPIVIAVIAGVELDKRLGTSPRFALGLTGLGLFTSMVVLYQFIRDLMHDT